MSRSKLSLDQIAVASPIVTPDTVPTIDKIEYVELKRKDRPRI
jgi:hypothetical protein